MSATTTFQHRGSDWSVEVYRPPFGPVPPRQGAVPRHHRGRRPARPLSRDEIVHSAITVAHAEGAGAVNMRRIARELDAGATSLYWHVPDKDHLLDLLMTLNTYVLDAVIRELQEMRDERDVDSCRPGPAGGRRRYQAVARAAAGDRPFHTVLADFDEDVDPDSPQTREERFEFGLRCVLDGIASQIWRGRP
ncbi:MAG TPA: TetR/AcrR family transcriptional regulator [Acidimicrobiales bacterium]|nr:TetR/AcrR family transcriptional regulator [Acidimicrobiales bacterium]